MNRNHLKRETIWKIVESSKKYSIILPKKKKNVKNQNKYFHIIFYGIIENGLTVEVLQLYLPPILDMK